MSNQESIKKAIARVTVESSSNEMLSQGSAFYIGSKFVLSALHIVAELLPDSLNFFEGNIKLDFTSLDHTTKAIIVIHDQENDWVLLECVDSPHIAPIEFGEIPEKGKDWESFGYPNYKHSGMIINGTITDPESKSDQGAVVLQLFCEQAAAGTGAALHGFSGAPCLINNKAVGVLRFTLSETLLDGQSEPKYHTKGGTVFSCRSKEIVFRKLQSKTVVLPNTWSTPASAEDFIVILSQAENLAKPKLQSVATSTYNHKFVQDRLSEPFFLWAEEMVSSDKKLEQIVRILCRADVVIFDATGFEPAIMLLMGVRALVRRGVTILSVGGQYALGKNIDVPYNISDANIVAHSIEQNNQKPRSVGLLRTRIQRSLNEIDSPYYLDLSVFDAIRKLPVQRRGIRAREEGVLVLCPFEEEYAKANWGNCIKLGLENQLDRFRDGESLESEHLGVARSFELNSPRLVSQAVYEEIRRAQACIVDLTEWSASVLFELGVRIAASSYPTICIIDQKKLNFPDKWKEQCSLLVKLFVGENDTYMYDSGKSFEEDKAYANMYGPDSYPPKGPASGSIHKLIEKELSAKDEPANRPVYRELLDSAEFFARDTGSGGITKPVGLFPGNAEFVRCEENAEFERLLASWYYLSNRFSIDYILANVEIRTAINTVITTLFTHHSENETGKLDEVPGLQKELNEMRIIIKDSGEHNA